MVVESCSSLAHIRTDDSQFPNIEIIKADFGRDADAPIDRLEGGVTMEEVERETKGLVQKKLVAIAEETRTTGLRWAGGGRRRHAAAIQQGLCSASNIEEHLLAKQFRPDRFIAFEAIVIERVVPVRLDVDGAAL